MSISNQFFSEKLLEGYVKTPLSLKEQAITRLTIQLAHHSRLKKVIVEDFDRQFECRWRVCEWGRRIGEQYSALCETLPLPGTIKALLIDRIWSIANRLFSWNREHRKRFPLPPNAADDILTLTDWTAEGRIDEIKVAERLVQDEKFPITQRYILACLHFMVPSIRPLWNQIPPERRNFLLDGRFQNCVTQSNLVKLWSYRMSKRTDETIIQFDKPFWKSGFEKAVGEGQRTAVVYCWNMLLDSTKHEIIVSIALRALQMYSSSRIEERINNNPNRFQRWKCHSYRSIKWCATPTHYSDILYFLVSQMSEEQMINFFRILLNSTGAYSTDDERSSVFAWLLESPYQKYFIPIVTKLWSILHEKCYLYLLYQLSGMYKNFPNKEEYKDYDYGSPLIELFQKTPDSYFRYIFSKSNRMFQETVFNILTKIPFQCKNLDIIECLLQYATLEEKRSLMYSKAGQFIFYSLIKSENLERLDLILSDCLPEKEIVEFRKAFLLSSRGREACFWKLTAENGEENVNSLLNWGHFSPEEISDFKSELIWNVLRMNELAGVPLFEGAPDYKKFCTWDLRGVITLLLERFDTKSIDRVLESCLASKDMQKNYKEQFLKNFEKDNLFHPLRHIPFPKCNLKCLTSKISEFLNWAFPSKEDRKHFKMKLFAKAFPQDVLGKLVLHEQWQDADFFVELFELSAGETKKLKIDVMWSIDTLYNIFDLLYTSDFKTVSHYLEWGLSDSKTLKDFEQKFDNFLSVYKPNRSVSKNWYLLIDDRHRDLAIASHVDLAKIEGYKE